MGIKIREAKPTDFDRLEEILSQNDMLTSPKTDDKESMKEIYQRMGRDFIIAEPLYILLAASNHPDAHEYVRSLTMK